MNVSRTAWAALICLACLNTEPKALVPGASDLAVKDRSNAYASIASSGKFVVVAWGATTQDGRRDLYAATSHDGGGTFAAPVRVNAIAGEANFSGEQPPRIALVHRTDADPAIVVVWTAKSPAGTRLLSARSETGGASFTRGAPVAGSDAAGNRGWESVAVNPDGSVAALWLDHRDVSPKPGAAPVNHGEHQHVTSGENKMDGVARAQLSQLFFAALGSPGKAQSIARGVCYCCKTAMTTGPSGVIYAAWRQVYDGNVRDIAFAKSSDRGRTFTTPLRISDDNWVLDGCPENGPGMAVDGTGRIHVVWPTLVPGPTAQSSPTLALFYATSDDGTRFTPRQQIPTEGVPRHAQLALGAAGQIVVAWDEQAGGSRSIAIARGVVDRNGTARFHREKIATEGPASYPVLARTDGATIVGWTGAAAAQTVIRVKRLTD